MSVDDWGSHNAKQRFTWICTQSAPSFTFLHDVFSEPAYSHRKFSHLFEILTIPQPPGDEGGGWVRKKGRTYCSGCLRRDQGGLCRCLPCWEPPPSTGSPARRILCTQSDNPTAERRTHNTGVSFTQPQIRKAHFCACALGAGGEAKQKNTEHISKRLGSRRVHIVSHRWNLFHWNRPNLFPK